MLAMKCRLAVPRRPREVADRSQTRAAPAFLERCFADLPISNFDFQNVIICPHWPRVGGLVLACIKADFASTYSLRFEDIKTECSSNISKMCALLAPLETQCISKTSTNN